MADHRDEGTHNGFNGNRTKKRRINAVAGAVTRKDARNNDCLVSGCHNGTCGDIPVLRWPSPVDFVPLAVEEAMVDAMMKRHGKRERGMLKDKPPFVVNKFRRALQEVSSSLSLPAHCMTLSQACSLRRHHIKMLNPFLRMPQLGLGDEEDIQKSAKLFEAAVEQYLNRMAVQYLTESEQRTRLREACQPLVATPDFVLPRPVLLRKVRCSGTNRQKKEIVVEERIIHWIEAKMYYGASTIPAGNRNGAVGTVRSTAQKYVASFGPGAILFMLGCGEGLAAELAQLGVSVLDAADDSAVLLEDVFNHQRTWCANSDGSILP